MKYNTLLTAAAILAIPSGLQAGEAISTNTQSYQAPMTTTQHMGWYLGAGVDYFFDSEEPFYNGHVGYDFGNGSSLFVESGWMGEEEDPSFLFPFAADLDIVPVTVNYKYEWMFTDSFGFYVGGGVGGSNVDINVGPLSDDEWVLTAQAFAGLVWNVTPSFEVYTGARYLWLDDIDIAGANIDNFDDVSVGAGIRFNF